MHTVHRGVVAILATCTAFWALVASGQTPPAPVPIQVVTPLPVVLSVRDPKQPSEVRTLELRTEDGTVPTAFQVVDARLPERPDDFSAAFTPDSVDVKAPLLRLPITLHHLALPFAGTYTVRLRPVRDGKPEPARDIQLTFQRPAARLRVQGPWQLEHTRGSDTLAPTTLLVEETSALASVSIAWPVAARLRGPGGESLSSELRLTDSGAPKARSSELAAGQKLELTPRLEGSVPLGVSTGTLRLESPQLAAPVEVDVRLVSRVWWGLLPITIAASVLLGLGFRQGLESTQKADEALLEARNVHARLEQLAASEADEGVRRKVREALQPLTSAIDSRWKWRLKGADALRETATKAGQDVDAALARAEERRGAVRMSLATLADALGHPAGHAPAIARVMGEARQQREAILRQLDRGHVEGPEQQAGNLEPEFQDKLTRELGNLGTSLSQDIRALGTWAHTAIPGAIISLEGALGEARTAVSGKDLAALTQSALKVAQLARALFEQIARPEVFHVAENVVTELGLKPGDTSVATMNEAVQAVLAPAAEEGPPYPVLTGAMAVLSAKLSALILDKAPPANKTEVEALLATGNYVKAAEATKPKLVSMGPSTAKAPTAQPMRLGVVNLLTYGTKPVGAVQIFSLIGPLEVLVGQTIELRPRVEPPLPEGVQVTWKILEGNVRETEHDGSRLVVVAQASGTLRVTAELRDPWTQQLLSVTGSIRILPSASELAAMDIGQRMFLRELLMTGIVGLFISAGGTLLFAETFHGSWRDFLIAALWGFSVDIGTTKLRDLAQPLTSQQIPVPKK